MRPTRIPGADATPLAAPADWRADEAGPCSALFIRRELVDNVPYMRSAWEVETTEAAMLFVGARLTLGIAGNRHPVVQLGLTELPPDFEPVVLARRFNHVDGRPCVRVEMVFPHAGGSRGWAEVQVDGTLADAVSRGVSQIEQLARNRGWIE